jgi:hypothetical protein
VAATNLSDLPTLEGPPGALKGLDERGLVALVHDENLGR